MGAKSYHWNGSTGTRLKKFYHWNGSTGTRLKKLYHWNGSTGTRVYADEETVFTNLSLETAVSTGEGGRQTKESGTYTASGYDTLTITGSTTRTIVGQGEYNCASVVTLYRSTNGSTWDGGVQLVSKSYNGTESSNISTSVNISGYSYFKIFIANENSTHPNHSNGKTSVTLTAVASVS